MAAEDEHREGARYFPRGAAFGHRAHGRRRGPLGAAPGVDADRDPRGHDRSPRLRSYRAEVFASGLAVLLMLGVAAYVLIEALGRVGARVDVDTGPLLIVGAAGLVINVIAMLLLRGGAGKSLNVKGAYLEVVADTVDTAGSVGVIAAG